MAPTDDPLGAMPSEASKPISFAPGFVFLSLLVSYVGAFTTIELLHRRNNEKGWIKWTQLFSCSLAFGFVCVWCMAFVANSAVILDTGDPELQLFYNPGFVVLSAVIPVVVSFLAFVASDFRYGGGKRLSISLATAGPVSGLAVVAMHYISSVGAHNYRLRYSPGSVAGAVVIACSACTVVFFLVFKLREQLLTTLKWRMLCALLLAAAVTGMHFEALVGTTYFLRHPDSRAKQQQIGTLAVALTLAGITLVADGLLFAHAFYRHRLLSAKTRQFVLACARFDHEGKIMVTREGMLPSRKLATQDSHHSFDDDFDSSHEAFQWIFRVSSDWQSIIPWLPTIRSHLRAVERANEPADASSTKSDTSSVWSLKLQDADFSTIFKESFCVAAADLAGDLKVSLHELGKVFGGVMASNSRDRLESLNKSSLIWNAFKASRAIPDVESGPSTLEVFGEGQVVFVLKRTDRKDVPKFQSMGYRFMPVAKVVPLCAEIMQIPDEYLQGHLLNARTSALDMEAYKKQPGGVFLAFFAVKPGVAKRTWDVLVNKDQLHKLPSVPLWSQAKMADRKRYVNALNGQSVNTCLAYLEQRSVSLDREEELFAKAFRRAIIELGQLVAEPFFRQATLSSQLLIAPVSDYTGRQTTCTLLSFHILPNIHECALHNPDRFTYIPLSFFKCRQQTLDRLPADPAFREKVHSEFTARFAGRHATDVFDTSVDSPVTSRRSSHWRPSSRLTQVGGIDLRSLTPKNFSTNGTSFLDTASVDEEAESRSNSTQSLPYSPTASEPGNSATRSSADSGYKEVEKLASSQASSMRKDKELAGGSTIKATFVDELFAIATAKWAKH